MDALRPCHASARRRHTHIPVHVVKAVGGNSLFGGHFRWQPDSASHLDVAAIGQEAPPTSLHPFWQARSRPFARRSACKPTGLACWLELGNEVSKTATIAMLAILGALNTGYAPASARNVRYVCVATAADAFLAGPGRSLRT